MSRRWTTADAVSALKRAGVVDPLKVACGEKPTAGKSKYGAKKKVLDGVTFASTREAKRYVELKAREAAGEIFNLQLQPRFTLQDAFRDRDGKHHRAITYVADFAYGVEGSAVPHVEDVKGYVTKEFAIKRKLFLLRYPDVHFEEVR